MGGIFEELKRRNVVRVAIAYLIAGWLVLQIADFVLENIAAPDWIMQVFLLMFALGLPLVLIFSWAYELTPEGLKREHEVDRSQSITGDTGRKLNQITIGMLIAVLIIVGLERTLLSDSTPPPEVVASDEADNSIAVLAFEDLSPDGDQAYFAEGLSEELLNVLAQVDELKVAGRTSSFAFKDQNKDLREIGEILNVAHILEGSVRKSGDRIRVTAQLIKASDGFHLFSETYDRDLRDVFAVQDEIASNISAALLSEIVGTEGVQQATATDPLAYEMYLLARQRIHSRDAGAMREASTMLDRALEIAPDYAPAYAQKALVTYLLSDSTGAYGDTPAEQAVPAAMSLVEKALVLDDELAEAYGVKGLLLDFRRETQKEAEVALRHALTLNPNLSGASIWLSSLLGAIGEDQESRELLERVVERDPMFPVAFNNLIQDYVRTGDFDQADTLISRASQIVGENDDVSQALGTVAHMNGNKADAVRHLQESYEANPNSTIVKDWYAFGLLDVADYETAFAIARPELRMVAAARLGDHEEVRRYLDNWDRDAGYAQRELGLIGDYMNSNGMFAEYVEFAESHFGTLDNLLGEFPVTNSWGTDYLGQLAYAHLQLNNEREFARLTEEMQVALAAQQVAGTDNFVHITGQAELAALSGDVDATLTQLQRALDNGFVSAGGFDTPILDFIREDSRFIEIERSLKARVDEERAKLGMPPYRPIAETD